jgi:hypothetical protein
MKQKVTAVFDIGKTNKKFYLFDENFIERHREDICFDEIEDEDGFPTENLIALQKWVKDLFGRFVNDQRFDIKALNFSAYGASFVHLDENGKVLTPLYNYLKPLNHGLLDEFYAKYGPEPDLSAATGSPSSGMLNSGLQLYWLKHSKPDIFKKIKYSLHLPQYLSYLFTGVPYSEYTSIGCHTSLWDHSQSDYHTWVYKEDLDKILPPIVACNTITTIEYEGKQIAVGIGIHDSSGALLPYIRACKDLFVLLSTGTWSVSLNPFHSNLLTIKELDLDCLNYLQTDGKAVKASKLLLGMEHEYQVRILSETYSVSPDYHKSLVFDEELYQRLSNKNAHCFGWKYLDGSNDNSHIELFDKTFVEAYHQLILELVKRQTMSISNACDDDRDIRTLFVEGGFANNDVFIKTLMLSNQNLDLYSSQSAIGPALGAALVISKASMNFKILQKILNMQKHEKYQLKKQGN